MISITNIKLKHFSNKLFNKYYTDARKVFSKYSYPNNLKNILNVLTYLAMETVYT